MTDGTRSELLSAGAKLFAEHGIDGSSMRELTRAAGQKNTNALQYHFGTTDGLLCALLEQHGSAVDQRRDVLLDQFELERSSKIRNLAVALVLPLVAMLEDSDGGPEYVRVAAEVLARPVRFAAELELITLRPSLQRWAKLVEPYLPEKAVGRPLHRRFAAVRFVHGELASLARERSMHRDHALFTSQLIDLTSALIIAPVSDETARVIRR
jgi:AcrR family transcriptional regulator